MGNTPSNEEVTKTLSSLNQVYSLLVDVTDTNIYMRAKYYTEPGKYTIEFTAEDKNLMKTIFDGLNFPDSIKPWSIKLNCFHKSETHNFDVKYNKFYHLKFIFDQRDAYNRLTDQIIEDKLYTQKYIFAFIAHLCNPDVSTFNHAYMEIKKVKERKDVLLIDVDDDSVFGESYITTYGDVLLGGDHPMDREGIITTYGDFSATIKVYSQ